MWYYLSRILVMVILSSAATWLMNVINNRMTYQTVKDIRAKAIRHIQVLPSLTLTDTVPEISSAVLSQIQIFYPMVCCLDLPSFFRNRNDHRNTDLHVLQKLLDYIDGHCPDPRKLLVAKFISSHTFQMFRKQSDARGRQTALIEEMIGNQKVVQAFGYEEKSSERFAKVNEELQECSLKAVFTAA